MPNSAPHADERTGEHIDFGVPPGVEVLQGGVARRGRARCCRGWRPQLPWSRSIPLAAAMASSSRRRPSLMAFIWALSRVAADARAEDRLRQIVADVQPELATTSPRGYAVGHTEMNAPCPPNSASHRLAPGHCQTVRLQLPVDDADGRLRVKTHSRPRCLMGGHLDERGQHMSRADLCGDELLAVNAVHQAHDDGAVR